MCVMSAVTDYYRREWPVYQPPPFPSREYTLDPSKIIITPEQWAEYQRLKAAAAEIDRVTGQPDCVSPGVAEWEAEVEKAVANGPVWTDIEHLVSLGIKSDTAHRMAVQTNLPGKRYNTASEAVHTFRSWSETYEGYSFWADISSFYGVARGA